MPKAFDTVVVGFAALSPKGEFESTAQYNARRLVAIGDLAGKPVLIAKEPESPDYFVYDADTRKLTIKTYAFSNMPFVFWSAFYEVGLHDSLDVGVHNNLGVIISQSGTLGNKYRATNGFGARVDVRIEQRVSKAIYERRDDEEYPNNGLFPGAFKRKGDLGQLELSPPEAQQLKPQLSLAFVVVPKAPYFVSGVHKPFKVTFSNPRDVSESFAILVADIQCGLVLDGTKKVIAAYPTR